MPSKVLDATSGEQCVISGRADAIIVPSLVLIDNVEGGGDRVIRLRDSYVTASSAGANDTSGYTDRLRIPVSRGVTKQLNPDQLKDIEVLGSLTLYCSHTDPDCHVTIAWSLRHEE